VTTYEILIMLDPELAGERQEELIARVRQLVERSGGEWRSHDAWGRRRLAYPIRKNNDGVYHLVVFDSPGDTLDEISRVLKIDDGVLRHMATRHLEGSRTSAPRDDAAVAPTATVAPAAAPTATAAAPPPVAVPANDYAEANTSSEEE